VLEGDSAMETASRENIVGRERDWYGCLIPRCGCEAEKRTLPSLPAFPFFFLSICRGGFWVAVEVWVLL
jgi:hypothetical protein